MPASEEWIPVSGWEGFYEVSSRGRVRSVDRLITWSGLRAGVTAKRRGKILTPHPGSSGYLSVSLCRDGKTKTSSIHRLVAEAFVRKPNSSMNLVVCHNDGNRLNCSADNLRWDTQSSNLADAIRHGNNKQVTKELCPRGHELSPTNNVAAHGRSGHRTCLSCNRAAALLSARSRRGGPAMTPELLQVTSDSYYQKLKEPA